MSSQSQPSDEDMPVTVPIRMVMRQMGGRAEPVRIPAPGPALSLHAPDTPETMDAGTMTPPFRVPVRLLSAAALAASITPAARRLLAAGGAPLQNAPPQLPANAQPRLRVVRGQRLNVEYPIAPGENFVGRRDEEPVDIDLEGQEHADRIWTSRQHAVIHYGGGLLEVEDLNSLNGTFVNRIRVPAGQRQALQPGDIIQVGTIQLKVLG